MEIVIYLTIYALIAILFFYLSLKVGKILLLYKDGYQSIASIEPDNSVGFNLIYRIIFTPVLILFVSIALIVIKQNALIDNLWVVTPLVVLLQFITIIVMNRIDLLNKKLYVAYALISILMSIAITQLIKDESLDNLLPEMKDVFLELFLVILAFIYGIIRQIPERISDYQARKSRYIMNRYRKLSKRFGQLLKDESKTVRFIVFAIMIYEDYNRPKIVRIVEKIVGANTKDIMQVKGSPNDEEGIKRTAERISRELKGYYTDEDVKKVISKHNPGDDDYGSAVLQIYKELMKNTEIVCSAFSS